MKSVLLRAWEGNAEVQTSPTMFAKALKYWDFLWQEVEKLFKRLTEMPGSSLKELKRLFDQVMINRGYFMHSVCGYKLLRGQKLAAAWKTVADLFWLLTPTAGVPKARRWVSAALLTCNSKYNSISLLLSGEETSTSTQSRINYALEGLWGE